MTRKALLVGINDYKEINDLNGCVNDVTNIRDVLLRYYDFTVPDIRVLVEKENILSRLKWLVTGAKKGDILVFQYSGHGTQIRDRNGDELKDHMDEAICPWGTNWDGGLILDDDLCEIFQGIKTGVTLEVILDSCFSGTGTREIALEKKMKIRFLAPPIDIECRNEEGLKVRNIGRKETNRKHNHVLWSGCKESQTSADALIGNTYNGAFTYFFCKHIRKTQGRISRSELIKRVKASLKYEKFSQVPQLETSDAAKKQKNIFEA